MQTSFKLLLIASFGLLASAAAQDERPNIIFLLADDQSTYTLGCYGNTDVQTPHIDQLSADGVTFDSHYDTTAICMASRASILTGMYEYTHGCNFGKGDLVKELWEQTYPMLLRKAGYRTAMAGKIGLVVDGVGLPEADFDKWGAGPGQTQYKTAKNKSMAAYAKEFPHSTVSYGAFGRDFVRESAKGEQPFCLSISFKAPHMPDTPDPQFDHVYEGKVFKKPENYGREFGGHFSEQSRQGRQYPRFESWGYADNYDAAMRKYHQLIYAIDQAVGMIRKELVAQGVDKNTVIIYTSDNGFLCGSHGYGSKVLPYEESTRVPCIVFDPRHESAGKKYRVEGITGNIDFAPTILGLANVAVPSNMQGTSLMPMLADPKARIHDSLAIMNVWGPTAAQSFGVVTNDWKYVFWFNESKGMTAAEELFDRNRDKLELKNAAKNPERLPQLEEMRKVYDAELAKLKAEAINEKYGAYGTAFDRTIAWEDKDGFAKGDERAKK